MSAAIKQTMSDPELEKHPAIAHDREAAGQRALGPWPEREALTNPGDRAISGHTFGDRHPELESVVNPTRTGGQSVPGVPSWIARLLRTPLLVKLVGANVLLLVIAGTVALLVHRAELNATPVVTVVIVAYLIALLVNTCLVLLAVHPLHVLGKTVDMIWHGDLEARVPASLLADRHVTRVARMLNILLDRLVADRERTRRLASEIISASDTERAAISRELHDSVAQSLAALVMQLGVAARSIDTHADTLRERIDTARTLANITLEEIRILAHSMHPRVLEDLGLVAALRRLARETTDHYATCATTGQKSGIIVDVVATDDSDDILSAPVKSVLYRVAQEALLNARRHAEPTRVEIRLSLNARSVTLEIADNGCGVDLAAMEVESTGIGLFTMRERVALVDGEFRVTSRAGGGTSVIASIPLNESSLDIPHGVRV